MSIKNWFSRTGMLAVVVCAMFTVALQAKTPPKQPSAVNTPAATQPSAANVASTPQSSPTDAASPAKVCYNKMRCMTAAMRKAAAARNAARRAKAAKGQADGTQLPKQPLATEVQTCPSGTMCPSGPPDYFGLPNYANTKPLQKFVNDPGGFGKCERQQPRPVYPDCHPF